MERIKKVREDQSSPQVKEFLGQVVPMLDDLSNLIDPTKAIATRIKGGTVIVSTIPFTYKPWTLGVKSCKYLKIISFFDFAKFYGSIWTIQYANEVWEEQLQQLTYFNNEFNHTEVPQQYTQNKSLGLWVMSQRRQYKSIEEGKPSHLTKERINSLNKIGFVWKVNCPTREEQLQQLVNFSNEFNHSLFGYDQMKSSVDRASLVVMPSAM